MKKRGKGKGNKPADGEGGFTLVELLVALALFGLLAATLFSSVRFGMNAWTRGTARVDQIDEILHAQHLLRSMIENAYPLYVRSANQTGQVEFEGTNESMTFLAPSPAALGLAGRSRFHLKAEHWDGRTNLRLTSVPELARPGEAGQAHAKTLLAGVEKVSISYLGAPINAGSPAWVTTWHQQVVLPRLVRIEVLFQAQDGRHWPDLVVAPRITADVTCVYDPLTHRCRGR
jgi:general secretion pathway protein J